MDALVRRFDGRKWRVFADFRPVGANRIAKHVGKGTTNASIKITSQGTKTQSCQQKLKRIRSSLSYCRLFKRVESEYYLPKGIVMRANDKTRISNRGEIRLRCGGIERISGVLDAKSAGRRVLIPLLQKLDCCLLSTDWGDWRRERGPAKLGCSFFITSKSRELEEVYTSLTEQDSR